MNALPVTVQGGRFLVQWVVNPALDPLSAHLTTRSHVGIIIIWFSRSTLLRPEIMPKNTHTYIHETTSFRIWSSAVCPSVLFVHRLSYHWLDCCTSTIHDKWIKFNVVCCGTYSKHKLHSNSTLSTTTAEIYICILCMHVSNFVVLYT